MSRIINMQGIKLPSSTIFHQCKVLMQVGNLQLDLLIITYNQLTKSSSQNNYHNSYFEIGSKIRLPQNIQQVKIIVHPKILNLLTQPQQICIDVYKQKTGYQKQLKFFTQLGVFKAYLVIEQQKFLAIMQTSMSSTLSEVESFKIENQIQKEKGGNDYFQDQKDKKTNSKDKNQPESIFKTVKMLRNNLQVCSDGALMNTNKIDK